MSDSDFEILLDGELEALFSGKIPLRPKAGHARAHELSRVSRNSSTENRVFF